MNNFDKNFLSRQVQKLELISELSTLKMLQWPLQPKTDFRPDDYIREDIVQIFKDHKLPTFLFNLIPFFLEKISKYMRKFCLNLNRISSQTISFHNLPF